MMSRKWAIFNFCMNCPFVLLIQDLLIKAKCYRKENFAVARSEKYVKPCSHLVHSLFTQVSTGVGKVPGDLISNYQPHTKTSILNLAACSIFKTWLLPKHMKAEVLRNRMAG